MDNQKTSGLKSVSLLEPGTHWDYIRVILGLYWDNGKENGNYYSIYPEVFGFSLGLAKGRACWFGLWFVKPFGAIVGKCPSLQLTICSKSGSLSPLDIHPQIGARPSYVWDTPPWRVVAVFPGRQGRASEGAG